MRRIRISTVVLGLLAFAALALAIELEYGRRNYDARMASMTPLRVALAERQDVFLRNLHFGRA